MEILRDIDLIDVRYGALHLANMELKMKVLSIEETQEVSGGMAAWKVSAMVALADSSVISPLAWSFGVGYAIGTVGYSLFCDYYY